MVLLLEIDGGREAVCGLTTWRFRGGAQRRPLQARVRRGFHIAAPFSTRSAGTPAADHEPAPLAEGLSQPSPSIASRRTTVSFPFLRALVIFTKQLPVQLCDSSPTWTSLPRS